MSGWWAAAIVFLVFAVAVNTLTDRLQTSADKTLSDRIDLVNSRVDMECGR